MSIDRIQLTYALLRRGDLLLTCLLVAGVRHGCGILRCLALVRGVIVRLNHLRYVSGDGFVAEESDGCGVKSILLGATITLCWSLPGQSTPRATGQCGEVGVVALGHCVAWHPAIASPASTPNTVLCTVRRLPPLLLTTSTAVLRTAPAVGQSSRDFGVFQSLCDLDALGS